MRIVGCLPDGKPFVVGLDAEDGRVVRAAPLVRYMIGWDGRRVADYCARRGWEWSAHPYDGP